MPGWGQCWSALTILRKRLFRITNKKQNKTPKHWCAEGTEWSPRGPGKQGWAFQGSGKSIEEWIVRVYNEFILTTYKELSLPGPSKANVSKGPEEESLLMASLGVSETEEPRRMRKKETTPPHPEIWKVSQWSQVPFNSWALPRPCPSLVTLPLIFF